MNIFKKLLFVSAFIPMLSLIPGSHLYGFERGGGNYGGNRSEGHSNYNHNHSDYDHNSYDHNGYDHNNYDHNNYDHNNYNHNNYEDRNAYEGGWNQGYGGGVYMQPNGNTLNQIDQYSNPNSAVNQNKRFNQSQQSQ